MLYSRTLLFVTLIFGALPTTVIFIATFVAGFEYIASHSIFIREIALTLLMYLAGGIGLTGLWVCGIIGLRSPRRLAQIWRGWLVLLFIGIGLAGYFVVGSYPWSYTEITLPVAVGPLVPAIYILLLVWRMNSNKCAQSAPSRLGPR